MYGYFCVDVMSNDAEFVNSDCKICVISLPETPSLRYEFISVCVRTCVCEYVSVCVYVYMIVMCVHIYMCVYVWVCGCVYIFVCVYSRLRMKNY